MGETVVSKVPCSVAIRTAQAMVQEVPEAAHSSISSLAQCGESHSERDTHRLANRFRLSVNIPISTMKVGEVLMPYLKMSHWAQFLISQGLWHHLAGLKQRDPERTAAIWRTFWDRYRCINPNHEIYKRTGLDLGSVCFHDSWRRREIPKESSNHGTCCSQYSGLWSEYKQSSQGRVFEYETEL